MGCSSEKLHAVMVLVASSLAHGLFCMVMDSGGVFHVLFLEAFGGGSGDTAFISSLNTAMFYAAGPVSAYLIQRWGFRTTTIVGAVLGAAGVASSAFVNSLPMAYLTFGFLGGFGLGLAYIPTISIVGFYFKECRPIAYAIASSGCGLGKLLSPYILQYCEGIYGWRGAITIFGAIALNVAVCGSIFREPSSMKPKEPSNISEDKISTSDTSSQGDTGLCKNSSMLRDTKFLCFCTNNFLFCVGYATALVHLPAYAHTLGITENQSSIFFSMFGPATIVGKISFGLVGQIKGIKHTLVYMIFFFICGVMLLFAPLLFKTFTDFMIFSITFGIMMSTFGATLPCIMVDLYDVASLSSAYGYLQLFDMMGFMLGPPVAGWLYDWTSHYPTSIYFGGASMILSALIIFPVWIHTDCYKPKGELNIDDIAKSENKALTSKYTDDVECRHPNHSPGVGV